LLVRNVQNVATSWGALGLGGVVTPGIAIFKNLDDTNYVEIGDGTTAFAKLLPGEQCILRLALAALQARANTAAVDLFYIIYDTS